jgi:hypothetical protein
MNGLGRNVDDSPIERKAQSDLQVQRSLHVLSVGPTGLGDMVHDALLEVPTFHLSIANDYRGLWMIPKQDPIDLVILHNVFTLSELEDSSRFVRRRWPHARILLVHGKNELLDDALYDERVDPNVTSENLSSTIQRLTGRLHEREAGDVDF